MRCFFTAPADLFFSEGNKVNYNIDNFFFCSEDDDIFNDYGEEMDLRPLTQEELRSAIINKVTRKSTCQRLYIRHARSTRLQWGPKNLMFYSTINLQLVELQNFRKLFCSVWPQDNFKIWCFSSLWLETTCRHFNKPFSILYKDLEEILPQLKKSNSA